MHPLDTDPETSLQWDHVATRQLQEMGLSWENARKVVGLIAEHRQQADREGWNRGFNAGWDTAKNGGPRN